MCYKPACLEIISTRSSMLPVISCLLPGSLNHESLQLRLISVIQSMLEMRRDSRKISPMFTFLLLSPLNYCILSTWMGGLCCMICLNRLWMLICPASVRLLMWLISKWVRLGQILAKRDTTSSSNGSHNLLNAIRISLLRLWSSRS